MTLTKNQNRRQQAIISFLKDESFATINDLAEKFAVTTQTIRRDVNALCSTGALSRFHGGVGLTNSIQNNQYQDRQLALAGAKDEIGKLVAEMIPNNASVFLNIGTTTETVAKHLLTHENLRIVTNNLHIAEIFSWKSDFEVMLAGGTVRGPDGGVVGEAAIEFLQRFRLDFGIIGISGIDRDGSLLDFDLREVRAAEAIIQNSRKVILVADHTKFGRPAMAKAGKLEDVDILVTDRPIPDGHKPVFSQSGVEIVVPN